MRSFFSRYILIVLVAGTFVNAQEKPVFTPTPELKIYGNFPLTFGENMLNEAHDAKTGWGFTTSPFSVYNFRIGLGFDYTKFDVTDASLAGNIERSELLNFYGYLAYPLKITEKLNAEPKFGIGGNKLRQKTGNKNFGSMKGTSFIAGTSFDYEIAYPLFIFAGADFVHTNFNVATHPDNERFFRNASQLNIFVGLKVSFLKRKSSNENQNGE